MKTREFLIDRAREDDGRRGRAAIESEELERRKALEHAKLRRMIAYAETAACLRATILRYFGDPAAREPCGGCGTCDRRERLGEADRLLLRKILSGSAAASGCEERGAQHGVFRAGRMLRGNVREASD